MTWASKIAEHRERQEAERQQRKAQQARPSAVPRPTATYEGNTLRAVPKTRAYRDQALTDMAQDRPCLLTAVELCTGPYGESTVACHSNFGVHGKGRNRKADDQFTVWGCAACHRWLDQPIGHGGPSKAEKERAFMAAHARQVLHWRWIAQDPSEPERYRNAARRALEALNATALPEDGDG